MNKYILPSAIIFGLVIIVIYSEINKNPNQSKIDTSITTTQPSSVEKLNSLSTTSTNASAPLPAGEDIIKTFFSLINEKKPANAISMMTTEMIGDESSKQAWGVQFNNINSVSLKEINSYSKSEWVEGEQIYKVILDIKMDPKSVSAAIPYYGWENGENTRWIVIKKDGNLWKISSINTGP